jgi:hypothetical protein
VREASPTAEGSVSSRDVQRFEQFDCPLEQGENRVLRAEKTILTEREPDPRAS